MIKAHWFLEALSKNPVRAFNKACVSVVKDNNSEIKQDLALAMETLPGASANDYHISLFGDQKDIPKIELILSHLYEKHQKNPSDNLVSAMTVLYGFLVGELCARKTGYGLWMNNDSGRTVLNRGNNKVIDPIGWCLVRVFKDPGNSLIQRYKNALL